MRLSIFCDFDETITRTNVTDGVLDRFADPQWMNIQDVWLAGKLTAREVLEKQMPLVFVTEDDLHSYVDSVEVDPFFAEFAISCLQNSDSFYILSDGFDYWINRILQRIFHLDDNALKQISVFACNLRLEQNKFIISFPYYSSGCDHGCATCKSTLFERLSIFSEKTIIIGDGVSDHLIAKRSDLVIAKDELRNFCLKEKIDNYSFNDFRDVSRIVSAYREKILGGSND